MRKKQLAERPQAHYRVSIYDKSSDQDTCLYKEVVVTHFPKSDWSRLEQAEQELGKRCVSETLKIRAISPEQETAFVDGQDTPPFNYGGIIGYEVGYRPLLREHVAMINHCQVTQLADRVAARLS